MTSNEQSVRVIEQESGSFAGHALGAVTTATAPPATLSLVVVDPHGPVREGLPLLMRAYGIEVVASTGSGETAIALIDRYAPDIALIALDLADADGIVLLGQLLERGTRSAIVLYAEDEGSEQAALALHSGAAGVVAKRRTIAELADALRVVAGGGLWFNRADDELFAAPPTPQVVVSAREGERRTDVLSGAELRVLALVADGGSTEAIARALSLSPHTVRTHVRNAMRKLEASSRAHAVAIAIREAAIVAG
jgi:DNA-binding NarL/FixJ family response regulator